jgi:hypothetical protein
MSVSVIPQKPRLLYEVSLSRKPYFRRVLSSLVGVLGALVIGYALFQGPTLGTLDPALGLPLTVIVIGIGVFFLLRGLWAFWYWLRTRNESLKFFNQGFVWQIGKQEHKYGWARLKAYREMPGGWYPGGAPLLQWGALRLTMEDGKVFTLKGRHGDLRQLAGFIRKPAATVTGTQMARLLREEKPITLSKQLTVWPGGIEVGKQEIPWSVVDVKLKDGTVTIYRQNAKTRKFHPVQRFPTRTLDNVGGFMQVVTGTIKNHQRERFGV